MTTNNTTFAQNTSGVFIFLSLSAVYMTLVIYTSWLLYKTGDTRASQDAIEVARIFGYLATCILLVLLVCFEILSEHYRLMGLLLVILQISNCTIILVGGTLERNGPVTWISITLGIFIAQAMFWPQKSLVGRIILPHYCTLKDPPLSSPKNLA